MGSSQVGVRELRQNLSKYLRRVASGERLEVTERGMPVAVLAPLSESSSPLQRLVSSGRARPPQGDLLDLASPRGPVTTKGSDALRELREDRRWGDPKGSERPCPPRTRRAGYGGPRNGPPMACRVERDRRRPSGHCAHPRGRSRGYLHLRRPPPGCCVCRGVGRSGAGLKSQGFAVAPMVSVEQRTLNPQVRGSNPGGPTTETAGRWLGLWCSNDGPTIRSAYFQFLPSGHSDVGTSTTTPSYPPSVTLGAGAVGPAVDRTTRPPAWSIWRGEGPRFRWTWTVPFGCQRSNENTSSGAGSDR